MKFNTIRFDIRYVNFSEIMCIFLVSTWSSTIKMENNIEYEPTENLSN